MTASALTTVAGATGLNVTATAVETVTGTATQMDALLLVEGGTGDKVNLDSDYNITISGSNATVTQANAYGAATDGVVTATISNTAVADLDDLTTANTDLLSITMAAEAVTAAQLITINGATGSTVNATAVTGITGTAAQFESVMDAEGGTGDKINLDTDFTANVTNGTTTAAQLAKIDAKTSKNVDASLVAAISGTASQFTTIAAAQGAGDNQYTLKGDVALTVTDTGTVDSGDLATIQGMSTGFTDATALTTVNGTSAEILALLLLEGTTGNKVGLDEDFKMTVSDGTVNVADVNTMGAFATTGEITATISDTKI